MFKVSKSGKGISEAALRFKRRWLARCKKGGWERKVKAGWGSKSREGKTVGYYSPGCGVAKKEGLGRP